MISNWLFKLWKRTPERRTCTSCVYSYAHVAGFQCHHPDNCTRRWDPIHGHKVLSAKLCVNCNPDGYCPLYVQAREPGDAY